MKKLLLPILLAAFILYIPTLSPAKAYSLPAVIERDSDNFSAVTTLTPGGEYWLVLGEYYDENDESRPTEKIKNIEFTNLSVIDDEDNETRNMIRINRNATKFKIDGTFYWITPLTVESPYVEKYNNAGFEIESSQIMYDWPPYTKNKSFDLTSCVNSTITYMEGWGNLEIYPQFYSYRKDDPIEMEFPDKDGKFLAQCTKTCQKLASLDYEKNAAVINAYPNAKLKFFNGRRFDFADCTTNGRLYINAKNGEKYIYAIESGNRLIDYSNTYESINKRFKIETSRVGNYVISDIPLDVKAVSQSTQALEEFYPISPSLMQPSYPTKPTTSDYTASLLPIHGYDPYFGTDHAGPPSSEGFLKNPKTGSAV